RCEQHGAVARVLRQLATARLAFLLDRRELRHDHRHHLNDDRRGDVRHDAEREDRQTLQRAAREHVEDVENRALLLLEEARERDRIDTRRRDERADAVDHQRAEQEEQALTQLREAGHLAECGERSSAGCFAAGGHGQSWVGGGKDEAYASILPPAPSIAARAPLVRCTPLTVNARATVPDATM